MTAASPTRSPSKRRSLIALGVVVVLIVALGILVSIAWPHFRTVLLLRELADLPDQGAPGLYEDELRTYGCLYRAEGCHVLDFGRIRFVMPGAEDSPTIQGLSGYEFAIAGDREAALNHVITDSDRLLNYRFEGDRGSGSFSFVPLGNDADSVEFTVHNGYLAVGDHYWAIQGDRKVVLLSEDGAVLRVYEKAVSPRSR